jgi:hypothetical protein
MPRDGRTFFDTGETVVDELIGHPVRLYEAERSISCHKCGVEISPRTRFLRRNEWHGTTLRPFCRICRPWHRID